MTEALRIKSRSLVFDEQIIKVPVSYGGGEDRIEKVVYRLGEDEKGLLREVDFGFGKENGELDVAARILSRLVSLNLELTPEEDLSAVTNLMVLRLEHISSIGSTGFGPDRISSVVDGLAKVLKKRINQKDIKTVNYEKLADFFDSETVALKIIREGDVESRKIFLTNMLDKKREKIVSLKMSLDKSGTEYYAFGYGINEMLTLLLQRFGKENYDDLILLMAEDLWQIKGNSFAAAPILEDGLGQLIKTDVNEPFVPCLGLAQAMAVNLLHYLPIEKMKTWVKKLPVTYV